MNEIDQIQTIDDYFRAFSHFHVPGKGVRNQFIDLVPDTFADAVSWT